jgi:gamma-glutamylputrescine oxidase
VDLRPSICVVGGGLTGLSAALHLAEMGVSVAVFEALTIGEGASGINGGQLHLGFVPSICWIETRLGPELARRLWEFSTVALRFVLRLIDRHHISCERREGLVEAMSGEHRSRAARNYVEQVRTHYGYQEIEWLDKRATQEALGSDAFASSILYREAGYLDPRRLVRGLADAARSAGAQIYECTPVLKLQHSLSASIIETQHGHFKPEITILAGDETLDLLSSEFRSRSVRFRTYMLETCPIGAGRPGGPLPKNVGATDDSLIVSHWRPTGDGRIIFGGGLSAERTTVRDIPAILLPTLKRFYPSLSCRVHRAWSGIISVTRFRLPYVRRVGGTVYAIGGYSGQGVALALYMGSLLASSIHKEPDALNLLIQLPCPPIPFSGVTGSLIGSAASYWQGLRDRG